MEEEKDKNGKKSPKVVEKDDGNEKMVVKNENEDGKNGNDDERKGDMENMNTVKTETNEIPKENKAKDDKIEDKSAPKEQQNEDMSVICTYCDTEGAGAKSYCEWCGYPPSMDDNDFENDMNFQSQYNRVQEIPDENNDRFEDITESVDEIINDEELKAENKTKMAKKDDNKTPKAMSRQVENETTPNLANKRTVKSTNSPMAKKKIILNDDSPCSKYSCIKEKQKFMDQAEDDGRRILKLEKALNDKGLVRKLNIIEDELEVVVKADRMKQNTIDRQNAEIKELKEEKEFERAAKKKAQKERQELFKSVAESKSPEKKLVLMKKDIDYGYISQMVDKCNFEKLEAPKVFYIQMNEQGTEKMKMIGLIKDKQEVKENEKCIICGHKFQKKSSEILKLEPSFGVVVELRRFAQAKTGPIEQAHLTKSKDVKKFNYVEGF